MRVLPESWIVWVGSAHVILSLIVAGFLATRFTGLPSQLSLWSILVLGGLGLIYLLLVIAISGWSGDCGCYPGMYESSTLLGPLLRDVIVLATACWLLRCPRTYGRSAKTASLTSAGILILASAVGLSGCSEQRLGETGDEGMIRTIRVHKTLGDYSIYRPISLAADGKKVFLGDLRDSEITVFNAELKPLRKIGIKGRGPGEFGRLLDIDAKAGLLVGYDQDPMRISLFRTSGELVRTIPVESPRWGAVALASGAQSFLLARYSPASEYLVSEFDLQGNLISERIPKPAVELLPQEAEVHILNVAGTTYVAFRHSTRLLAFGDIEFDYEFDLPRVFPFLIQNFSEQERLAKLGGVYLTAVQGDMDVYRDYLVIAGPVYHLLIFNTNTHMMRAINMDPMAEELLNTGGHATWNGVVVTGEHLLLASQKTSSLVQLRMDEVLSAAERGPVVGRTKPKGR